MAASPRSSASSDLYSSSELPQYKLPGQEDSVQKDSSQAIDADPHFEEGSDMMKGLDSSSEDSHADISFAAAARSGKSQETVLKRKRDDDQINGPCEQGAIQNGGVRKNRVQLDTSSWRSNNGSSFPREPMNTTNIAFEARRLENHGQPQQQRRNQLPLSVLPHYQLPSGSTYFVLYPQSILDACYV